LCLHEAYAPKDPKEAAHFAVKVVVIDVPRPQLGVWMPDIGPGDPLPPLPSNGCKGASRKSETYFVFGSCLACNFREHFFPFIHCP